MKTLNLNKSNTFDNTSNNSNNNDNNNEIILNPSLQFAYKILPNNTIQFNKSYCDII
jgi:hypothetical protein